MSLRNYLDLTRSNENPFMRDVFIDKIYEAAKKNKNIFFITPDMGAPSLDKFRKELPQQFIHSGICEQHMITMAAGLSLMGKKVFCYAMAPFITSRCYEQIKCSIAAMNQNVNLIAIGVGLGYADAGPTHYTTEDLATMRVFPNIEIFTPCDEVSTNNIADHCLNNDGFRFIRLDRDALPKIYEKNLNLDLGFSELVKSKKTCIVTSGYLLNKIYHLILKENKDVGLIDLYKFKPINKKILDFLKNYKKIISIEEQWLEGGMGSKLLELLNDENFNINIKRYGLDERFYFENGGRDYLHKNYGLDIEKILSNL